MGSNAHYFFKMQQDVFLFLKKNKNMAFTTADISSVVNVTKNRLCRQLNQLINYDYPIFKIFIGTRMKPVYVYIDKKKITKKKDSKKCKCNNVTMKSI